MTDEPKPPYPPVPAEPPPPAPGSGPGMPLEQRAVPSANFAADLAICLQHMASLEEHERRWVTKILNYEPFITADDVTFVSDLAARLRAAGGNMDPESPSADILPFPPRAR
jgi:hypothetical protein